MPIHPSSQRTRAMPLWLVALCASLLLGACGANTTPQQPSNAAQPAVPTAEAPTTADAPATETTEPSAAQAEATGGQATATELCAAQDTTADADNGQDKADDVIYNQAENTIVLEKGADTTLAGIAAALDDSDVLRELAPGEWLLQANLQIDKGAELTIAAPEVHRLKLKSDDGGFVWIKGRGGDITFEGVCVTSWDEAIGQVDENYADGRSFVLARDGSQMKIRNSELSYLGYDANESYGLAWRLEGTSGEIIDSVLGFNYYGLYTLEVRDLVIRGNEVHHNILYGIDPHTKSRRLTIEDNVSHHNGKHGIILAEDCTDSVIRNNTVYNNAMHGIVLYQRSNENTIEGNTSYGNGLEGINLNGSSDNIVRNNTVYENTKAGIGIGQGSKNNTISGNTARNNLEDGIALYSEAKGNTVEQNDVRDNARFGIYIKSPGNTVEQDNVVSGNRKGDVEASGAAS